MTAGLRSGQALLLHGGGSGIGTHATQVGRALGADVAATAGSDGTVAPVVSAEIPLSNAGAAQALLDSADSIGKVLLTIV